jgi:hypothetical protein
MTACGLYFSPIYAGAHASQTAAHGLDRTAGVRDVDTGTRVCGECDAFRGVLVTASFDSTIKIWHLC